MEIRQLQLDEALAFTTAEIAKLAANSQLNMVLTGGRTGIALARAAGIALKDYAGAADIWFSDERFVEFGDLDRTDVNLVSAMGALAATATLHRVATPSDGTLMAAAKKYSDELAAAERDFDLVILSMGEDGHIASLFPGHSQLASAELAVAELDSPKPPAQRVSIGLNRLARARQIHIYAMGEGKRQALRDFENTPAGILAKKFAEISPQGQLLVLSDIS
jgi:6-phosphogluconolactonase